MKHWTGFVVIAVVVAMMMSITTLAAAQDHDARLAAFAVAEKRATSVPGVQIFAAQPKGFNPLTATKEELWKYGLPEAPDKNADPIAYQLWARSMSTVALKTTATDVKALPYWSTNMKPAGGGLSAAIEGVPTTAQSYNWSGIANTNKLTKWSNYTSFDYVVSYFTVPVAKPPFGGAPCADGPWYESSWNGIDGMLNGDVVQGGSFSYVDCSSDTVYLGWVEWYPSYAMLAIYCGSSYCPVSPGDDFIVVTYGAAGTATQSVYIDDDTQQWHGTFSLPYVSGQGVVGSSAEYIVERPCCLNTGYPLPLMNYDYTYWGYNYARDVHGTYFYPGSTAPTTYVLSMVDDAGTTTISMPFIYGTSGNAGKYSISMEDVGCAYIGGCTP